MKTMAITDFKTHALGVLKRVSEGRESIVVTKRGKPIAEVIPYMESKPVAGKLSDALVFEKDIVSPLGENMWDACK
jgi:prevent-host-death family protein